MKYSIVSMSRTGIGNEEFVKALAVGTELTLIREPNNRYDGNAVMVFVGSRHIGYIPANQNKVLAQHIDHVGEEQTVTRAVMTAHDSAAERSERAKAVTAKFIRSPNSHYPMAEVRPRLGALS